MNVSHKRGNTDAGAVFPLPGELLVAKRMYIDAPDTPAPVTASFLLNFSIFLCVAGVVGFGVYPKPLVMAALRAASSLF